MARIQSPGHKDCHIDCPGSGYAYYNPPFGPCETGCDESKAGDALLQMLLIAKPDAKFSGRITGVTTGVLADFAGKFAVRWPSIASSEIDRLKNAAILTPDRRISAYWEKKDIAGIIIALADELDQTKAA